MLLSVPFAIVGFLGFNAWITVVFMGIAQTAPHTITGPGQATVQELVGQRMRGTAQALNFFTISLISGAIGPVLIGAASDALHAHFGEQSLRIALLGTTLVSIWSALHFYLASRHIEHDLSANNVRREVPDTPNLLYPAPLNFAADAIEAAFSLPLARVIWTGRRTYGIERPRSRTRVSKRRLEPICSCNPPRVWWNW